MKRVVMVPVTDVDRFPDLEVIARDGALVALVGNSAPGRTRDAYDSEEAFLNAVALGLADRRRGARYRSRYSLPRSDEKMQRFVRSGRARRPSKSLREIPPPHSASRRFDAEGTNLHAITHGGSRQSCAKLVSGRQVHLLRLQTNGKRTDLEALC